MSWTGSERKRRPQSGVSCPDRFRGSRRYVPASAGTRFRRNPPALAGVMPFGRHRNQHISSVSTSYLQWFLAEIKDCDDLKIAIRAELQRRESQQAESPTCPACKSQDTKFEQDDRHQCNACGYRFCVSASGAKTDFVSWRKHGSRKRRRLT